MVSLVVPSRRKKLEDELATVDLFITMFLAKF
jgi:hypothetical protein